MATERQGGTEVRKLVFAVFAVATVVAVVLSVVAVDASIPPRIYLFGFLGGMVYVFTSLAEKFDEEDRYALEVASKGVAAFPLAAGVYLLAFAFPAAGGDATTQPAERIISGLVFLSGAYVSLTLRALGSLARRMLGVSGEERGQREGIDDRPGTEPPEPPDSETGDGRREPGDDAEAGAGGTGGREGGSGDDDGADDAGDADDDPGGVDGGRPADVDSGGG